MRRRGRRWRGDRRTPVGRAARSDALGDAAGDGPPKPKSVEDGALEPETDLLPLEIEEQFGVPKGAGDFFRINTASGRSFAVWAPTEVAALTAAERIDRTTTATGYETFRIAAVPLRRRDRLMDDGGIAKVREIKS